MKRRALALCAGLLLVGLVPGWTLANSPVVDQHTDPATPANATWFPYGNTLGDIGQTLTVGITGQLTQVDLDLKCSGLAAVVVMLRDGSKSGPILTDQVAAVDSVAGAWYHVSFAHPPSVKASQILAIEIQQTMPASCYVYGSNVSSYAGGDLYQGYPATENPNEDLAFTTYVQAPPLIVPHPSLVFPLRSLFLATPTASPTTAPTAKTTPQPAPAASSSSGSAAPSESDTPSPVATASSSSGSAAPSESDTPSPVATASSRVSELPTSSGTSGSSSGDSTPLIVAAIIVVLVVIAGGLGFMFMRRRRKADSPPTAPTPDPGR